MISRNSKIFAVVFALLLLSAATLTIVKQVKESKEQRAQALLNLIPGDASLALVLPHHRKALEGLQTLVQRFKPHMSNLEQLVAEGSRRSGFDLGKPETMQQIGINPDGGSAIAAGPRWAALWLAIHDREAYQRYQRDKLAQEYPEPLEWTQRAEAGLELHLASTAGQKKSTVLAMAFHQGYVIVVPARGIMANAVDPVSVLRRVAEVSLESSLGARAELRSLQLAQDQQELAVLWADSQHSLLSLASLASSRKRSRDAQALQRAAGYSRGALLTLKLEEDGLHLPFRLGVHPEREPELRTAWTPDSPGPDFGALLPRDTMLFFSMAANAKAFIPWLRTVLLDSERKALDAAIQRFKTEADIDLVSDVLAHTSGHLGFAFHTFNPAGGLRALGRDLGGAASQIAKEPWSLATTTYLGLARPETLASLVEGGAQRLAAGESKYEVVREGKEPRWRFLNDKREIAGFAVHDKLLIFTTGAKRLKAAVDAIEAAKLPVPDGKPGPGLRARVKRPAAHEALSGKHQIALLFSVPALMSNFPILNLIPAIANPLRQIGELSLRFSLAQGGTDGELLLTIQPPPSAKKGKTPPSTRRP